MKSENSKDKSKLVDFGSGLAKLTYGVSKVCLTLMSPYGIGYNAAASISIYGEENLKTLRDVLLEAFPINKTKEEFLVARIKVFLSSLAVSSEAQYFWINSKGQVYFYKEAPNMIGSEPLQIFEDHSSYPIGSIFRDLPSHLRLWSVKDLEN